VEEQFISLLIHDAAVASLVGDRVWPGVAKQGTAKPYAVVQEISRDDDYTTVGASGFVQSRMQVDSYGESYAAAKRTARAIRHTLSGRRGGIFKGIFAETERDLSEQNSVMTTAERLYRVTQDYMVHHTGD
jgi:hypothetical protein